MHPSHWLRLCALENKEKAWRAKTAVADIPDTRALPGSERTILADVQILSLVSQDAKCGSNGGIGHTGGSTTREGRSDKPTLVSSSLLAGRAGIENLHPGQHS